MDASKTPEATARHPSHSPPSHTKPAAAAVVKEGTASRSASGSAIAAESSRRKPTGKSSAAAPKIEEDLFAVSAAPVI